MTRHVAASLDWAAASGSSSAAPVVIAIVIIAVVLLILRSAIAKPPATQSWAKPKPTSGSQLRHDGHAGFIRGRGFLYRPVLWFQATGCPPVRIAHDSYEEMAANQQTLPQKVTDSEFRTWWWFSDNFYWESGHYGAPDVLALLRDRERREQAKLRRAHMLLNADQNGVTNRRQPIPRELRRLVFERDGGTCVECDSKFDLQYDHVIPVALGGATSLENLQLLCGACNQAKSASI